MDPARVGPAVFDDDPDRSPAVADQQARPERQGTVRGRVPLWVERLAAGRQLARERVVKVRGDHPLRGAGSCDPCGVPDADDGPVGLAVLALPQRGEDVPEQEASERRYHQGSLRSGHSQTPPRRETENVARRTRIANAFVLYAILNLQACEILRRKAR